jgi:predicted ATPase
LHKTEARDRFHLALSSSHWEWGAEFAPLEDRDSFLMQQIAPIIELPQELFLMLRSMTYLSADRLGPSEIHQIDVSPRYNNVGVRGEWTISRLLELKSKDILPELRIPEVAPLLYQQVSAQMRRIFPGFRIRLQSISDTNLATLVLSTNDIVSFVRPQNMGYGLSSLLPIYVACLSADRDNIILVENPEAHLHPSAQAHVGMFLAKVAAAGVQVIVETHSDHFLNGVRKAVKSKQQKIKAEDVAIFFFEGISPDGKPQIIQPIIAENGGLDDWPDGFFDQYEKDLAVLIDW